MPIDRPGLRTFSRDEDGAVAVIVSLVLTVLLGFAALGVDVASLYRARAQLQSVSDLTAISSVADHTAARTRALEALGRNAKPSGSLGLLQTGRYLRNPDVPARDRFTPLPAGSPGINAVHVTLQEDSPLHFARIFTTDTHVGLNRSALASRTGAASFSLDSNLVRIDTATLNNLLHQKFGAGAILSVGDIGVLAGATLDLGALLAALEDQAGLSLRNPAEILDMMTTPGGILAALRAVLPPAVANRLPTPDPGSSAQGIAVAAVVGGIDTDLGLTVTEFLAGIEVSALDVIKAMAAIGPHQYATAGSASLSVPGILAASADVVAGEAAADSGWVALGEEGVQLHRAAVRLRTTTDLSPALLGDLGLGVSATRLTLPVHAEVAGATATLETLRCTGSTPGALAARFRTAPTALHPLNGTSVAAFYLGTVDAAAFANGPIDPSNIGFADILDLSITIDVPVPLVPDLVIHGLTIQARSHVAVGTSQRETVNFTRSDIAAGNTTARFGSENLLSSAVTGLLSSGNTEFRVKPGQEGLVAGLAEPVVNAVLALLPDRILSTLAAPLDAVLDTTLLAAGIRLGEGELTLTGHHCEPIRLVR